MPLPVGAGNSVNSIPYTLQNNAARSPSRAMQNSRAKTLSFDNISPSNLIQFVAADTNDGGWAMHRAGDLDLSSPLMDVWKEAMFEGNPKGKTLQDLTSILKLYFRTSQSWRAIMLAGPIGQAKIMHRRGLWRGYIVY